LPSISKYCVVLALNIVRIERRQHTHPIHALLLHAIDLARLRQPCGVENGRGDIGNVLELVSHAAAILDMRRP
jgi:hypothetical protein